MIKIENQEIQMYNNNMGNYTSWHNNFPNDKKQTGF